MEALSSSETSVLTRAKRRDISEDSILHSHRRENLKSYSHNSLFFKELTTQIQIPVACAHSEMDLFSYRDRISVRAAAVLP
jgi:hypothetical protein